MKHTYALYIALGLLGVLASSLSYAGAHPDKNDHNQQALQAIMLGELAANQNQMDTARLYYAKASKLSADPEIAKRALYFALSENQPTLALQAAKHWAITAPGDMEAQLVNLDLLLKNNQAEAALPYLQAALQSQDKNVLSVVLNEVEQIPVTTQKALLQAISQLPLDQQNALHLQLITSVLQYQTDQLALALATIDNVLKNKPDWVHAIALKAEFLLNNNQITTAETFVQEKAAQYPALAMIQLIDAEILLKIGKKTLATQKLEQLQKFPETRGFALLSLAQLALEDKNFAKATHYLNQATQDEEEANAAYFMLGEVYEFQHQPAKALDAYQHVQSGNTYLTAQLKVAAILTNQGKLNDALDHLDQIDVSSAKEAKQVILLQTELLIKLQREKTAMDILDRAIVAIPNDIQLLYARSAIAHHLNHNDIAEDDLKKIIAIDPQQPSALNALGSLLTNNPTRYTEALDYTKKALAIEPNNPMILDSMGWLQYRMGNYQVAFDYLQRAYKLQNDSIIAAHLGTVLWALGNKAEAKKVLEAALKKAPQDSNLLNTLQSLSQKEN